jgi:hypothetical protein
MRLERLFLWRVRSELDFGHPITLQGRDYRLIATRIEHDRAKPSNMLVWEGRCVTCKQPFQFKTTRNRFYPAANCPLHRRTA